MSFFKKGYNYKEVINQEIKRQIKEKRYVFFAARNGISNN